MKVRISDIPNEKSFEDYPEDTVFIWGEKRPEGIFNHLFFTKDKIKISRSEYRVYDLIEYLTENKLSEEEITIEELERFKI